MKKIIIICTMLLFTQLILSQKLYLQGGLCSSGLSYNIYANNMSFINGYNSNIIAPIFGIGIEYFDKEHVSLLSSLSHTSVGGDLSSDVYGVIYRNNGFAERMRLNKLSVHQQLKLKLNKNKKIYPYLISGGFMDFLYSKSKIVEPYNSLFYTQYENETKKILLGLSVGLGVNIDFGRYGFDLNLNYQKPITSFVSAEYTNGFLTHMKGDYSTLNILFGISYNLLKK